MGKGGVRLLSAEPSRQPKPSPLGEAIAAEAERLGITQGQLLEQMWELYRTRTET